MKEILGIVGSPRKGGNTHVLVSAALEAARQAGAETSELLLGELDIRECDGCHACWASKPCPKDDDMNALFGRIAHAGALILGTPVYWYGPTALMKAFIDRLAYFNCPANRPGIRGKPIAIIIPFEEESLEVARPVVEFFDRCCRYLEAELIDTLLVPGVTRRGEVAGVADAMGRARQLGQGLTGR